MIKEVTKVKITRDGGGVRNRGYSDINHQDETEA